jgi:hypothetical protein
MHILVIRDCDIVAILISAVLIQEKEKETLTHRLFNTVDFRNKKKKKPSRSGVVHVVVWWVLVEFWEEWRIWRPRPASVTSTYAVAQQRQKIFRNRRDACREIGQLYTRFRCCWTDGLRDDGLAQAYYTTAQEYVSPSLFSTCIRPAKVCCLQLYVCAVFLSFHLIRSFLSSS